MKVGIVGLGSIGRTIARNLHEGKIPKAVLAGATVRDRVKAEAFLQEIGSKAPILAIKELAANADIVVECAPPAVLAEIAVPILSAGKKLMVLSAGMLLRHPELIALAKAKPNTLSFASGGSGSTSHLCGELLKTSAGIDIVHVPYKGPAPALQDLLAGQVPLMCNNFSNVISHVRAGRLRAIALTAKTRHPQAPDVPTAQESGLPEFEVGNWYGFVAPSRTPKAVIDKLHAEFVKALRSPVVAERLDGLGLTIVADSPKQFGKFIAAESAKWRKVVEVSGARVD